MTESQAWRIVAEEHDAGRTRSPYLCDNLKGHLMGASYANAAIDVIPPRVRSEMVARIERAMPVGAFTAYPELDLGKSDIGYSPAKITEARRVRVLACLLFAEMSK